MKGIKKMAAGLALAAVLASGGLVTIKPAHAQVAGVPYGPAYGGIGIDPIAKWIVLSGLFYPTAYNTAGVAGTTNGTVVGAANYDPISTWIVLSGLFSPYGTGGLLNPYAVNPYGAGVMVNPNTAGGTQQSGGSTQSGSSTQSSGSSYQ